MAILSVVTSQIGTIGVLPSIAYIGTNDTEATVLTTGYLNNIVANGTSFSLPCVAVVATQATSTSPLVVGWFNVAHVGADWSLTPTKEPAGGVILPTIANHIATYTDTSGTLSEDPAIAITTGNLQSGLSTGGSVGLVKAFPTTGSSGFIAMQGAVNGSGNFGTTISNATTQAQAQVITIPSAGTTTANFILSKTTGTQHITVGALEVDAGALTSGLSTGGFVGLVKALPTTASSGFIAMQGAVNGSGDFGTTISNATTQAQASVISIPDPGATTANFLLDTGTSNILAQQQFVGINHVLTFGTGTWTTTRIAQGNYVSRHTAGDETSIIAIDITPIIRVAASKGFRLDSFDYIYSIATLAMDAHSLTLDRIAYANNVAVSVTSIPITAALATATQANPYVTNCTVTTPAFDITADSKYVIEVTADNSATSAYDFYGVMLRFSQTVA